MLRLADILEMVAQGFGLDVATLRTPSKKPALVQARDAYAELARRYTMHAAPAIGQPIGATADAIRDGHKRFEARMRDPAFRILFAPLDATLTVLIARKEVKGTRYFQRGVPDPSARTVMGEFYSLKHQIEKLEKEYARG